MSYQALARKWRPRNFSELVGQTHVVRALTHSLAQQRLHHALLFSGTRGVGKTTLGRIIAKCLNCENGISATPCTENLCSACTEIDEGRFVDLIEVDAASRTGVEDTRELMENVQYAPTRGRYKVYLIDEVHMLSRHAFNALLKTLEEPPPHIQFLLATTDPQKLPITVLSRCLQFPLKRLPLKDITGQLDKILTAEGLVSEPAALTEIARAADGSMRDALSLMDQAIAFGDGTLSSETVLDMLGSVTRTSLQAILQAIAARDGSALMQALQKLDEQAPDYAQVLEGISAALHNIALLQMVPNAPLEDAEIWTDLAHALAPEDVQLYYDIALAGRRDLDWAPDPKSGVEMACLRMLAFTPGETDVKQKPLPSKTASPTPAAQPNEQAVSTPAPQSVPAEPDTQAQNERVAPSSYPQTTAALPTASAADWDALVARLPLRAMSAELARNCICKHLDAESIELELPESLKHLLTDNAKRQMQQALQETISSTLNVNIKLGTGEGASPAKLAEDRAQEKQAQARRAIEEDEMVQALQSRLGAKVRDDSIQPEGDDDYSR